MNNISNSEQEAKAAELKRYFELIVKPTVEEFLEGFSTKTDIRKAALATIVLTHMTDQFGNYEGTSSGDKNTWSDYLDKVKSECPEMEALRKCCNFVKHKFLESKQGKLIQETKLGFFHAPFGYGYFAETSYVHYDDVQVPSLTAKALLYWQSKMDGLPN